ncbi:hypothetical protein P775_09755 [Puniceibacterium antarcticum]|uniref:Uncharacterized protein n=1 Tax=Puniceibacterium antarcticum TaxID=1206336 RepID=A0A2G8RFQ0_9RHOB|nr:hypothetical protein [Puniceibacterium antarcticum]PIL20414.1 hypothetical protein P775_09755 [Puniceibacterium antarcticum]
MSFESEMMAFVTSDARDAACDMVAGWVQVWGANSLAHFAIGTVLAVLRFHLQVSGRVVWGIVSLLIAKEIFFDIPLAGFAVWVMLDSLWDVACYAIGVLLVWWTIMRGPVTEGRS